MYKRENVADVDSTSRLYSSYLIFSRTSDEKTRCRFYFFGRKTRDVLGWIIFDISKYLLRYVVLNKYNICIYINKITKTQACYNR